jgi:hypothetical protein
VNDRSKNEINMPARCLTKKAEKQEGVDSGGQDRGPDMSVCLGRGDRDCKTKSCKAWSGRVQNIDRG